MKQQLIEFGIAVGLAVAVTAGQALATLDADVEPRVFVVTLAGLVLRTVGTVVVARLGPKVVS